MSIDLYCQIGFIYDKILSNILLMKLSGFKYYKNLFTLPLMLSLDGGTESQGTNNEKVKELVDNDDQLDKQLKEIDKLFLDTNFDDLSQVEKNTLHEKWLGKMNTLDDGIVDNQVFELYNVMSIKGKNEIEIKSGIGNLLTQFQNDIQGVFNTEGNYTVGLEKLEDKAEVQAEDKAEVQTEDKVEDKVEDFNIKNITLPEGYNINNNDGVISITNKFGSKIGWFTVSKNLNNSGLAENGKINLDKVQKWGNKKISIFTERIKNKSTDKTTEKTVIESTTDTISNAYESTTDFLSENYEKLSKIVQDVLDIDAEIGEFGDVEIEYDKERQVIELDTPFFDGVADYDTSIDLKSIDISTEEKAKQNISKKITELKAEYKEKLKTSSLVKEFTDSVGQGIDNTKQKVSEYLKNFPDAGEITLDNGEKLEVEYDKLNNTLYVDTQFFDEVDDYATVKVKITEKMTGEEIAEAISDANTELKDEYQDKVESVELEKQNKKIREVFSGNKKFTTVGKVKIGDESMNVRLVRRGVNEIKIKLDTPFGDEISDKDVTIDFTKVGESFKNMKELRDSITTKTGELEKKYKELLKKNTTNK